MSKEMDALLDRYATLHKALQVLHLESDTDLPFSAWVEVSAMRHIVWVNRLDKQEVQVPDRICPERDCVGAYYRDPKAPHPLWVGTDSNGNDVYIQKWNCSNGHWHTIEEAPHGGEEAGPG